MKRIFLKGIYSALLIFGLVLTSCDNGSSGGEPGEDHGVFSGFHNYPAGRTDPNGTLEIKSNTAGDVVVFKDSVGPANYLGTIGSLSSITVRLPEEKFYTVVAVDKRIYEKEGERAFQFSSFTFYSNSQRYSISVSPSGTAGNATWILNNYTNYWVEIRKTDGTGRYAVLAPQTVRVSVPITLGQTYDFFPHFYRELKHNGKVIALAETTDVTQGDTADTDAETPVFTTDIRTNAVPVNLKPVVFVHNNTDKTVRVYYANNQITNGSPGQDFTIRSGIPQLVSGFSAGQNTNGINFRSVAWQDAHRYITAGDSNVDMQINKVYKITLNSDGSVVLEAPPANAEDFYQ
jgi:hypothetical protein